MNFRWKLMASHLLLVLIIGGVLYVYLNHTLGNYLVAEIREGLLSEGRLARLTAAREISEMRRDAPTAALAALTTANVTHVLNDYNFGGYLIAAGVPTFIDGRTELFGADFLLRYVRDMRLENIPDLLKLLDEQKIDATLLMPSTPPPAFLDGDPGWKRL